MIKSISAKNFQSWDSLKFDLDHNITLIQGYNADDDCNEGSGKSATVNALCWILFGEIPKDIKVDEVVRRGQKGCYGEVTIDHPVYKSIVRSRTPNKVYLLTLNDEIITGKDAKETQEMIDNVLGMSFKTFCMSCYFPQNQHDKFISSTPEEKAKILSEILNLQVFDKAYKKAHDMLKVEKSSHDSLKVTLNGIISEQSHIGELLGIVDKRMVEREEQAARKVKEVQTRIDDMEMRLCKDKIKFADLSKIEVNEEAINSKINELEAEKAKVEKVRQETMISLGSIEEKKRFKIKLQNSYNSQYRRLESLAKELAKLEAFVQNPTKICPTCGTTLENADTSHAVSEMESISKSIEELAIELDSLDAQIKAEVDYDETQLKNETTQLDIQIRVINAEIKQENQDLNLAKIAQKEAENLSKQIERQKEDLAKESRTLLVAGDFKVDDLVDEKAKYELKLETCNENLLVTQALLAEKSAYIDRLDMLKTGFKEVKSYVFNSSLGELSRKLNKYSSLLFEMPIKVNFNNDDMKITTRINLNGEECSLGTLSGGQGARLALAGDLALAEMVSVRKSNINLAIFDEPFQNLSESSMIKCIEIFKTLNKPTIIIEHNSVAKTIVNKTFTVELKGGISREI